MILEEAIRQKMERAAARQLPSFLQGVDEEVRIGLPVGEMKSLNPVQIANLRRDLTSRFAERVIIEERSIGARMKSPLPVRIDFEDAGDLAKFLFCEKWEIFKLREEDLLKRGASFTVLGRQWRKILDMADPDWTAFLAFLDWRIATEGEEYIRSVPLPGVGGKWLEKHLKFCVEGLQDIGAAIAGDTAMEQAGLTDEDRLLLPLKCYPGDLDLGLGGSEGTFVVSDHQNTSKFEGVISQVIVVENKQTFIQLRPAPGVLAVFGQGRAVGAILARMQALKPIPVTYWGDADSYGFVCLSEARAAHGAVSSIRMEEGLLACPGLTIGPEPAAARLSDVPKHLTQAEASLCLRLKETGQRVEQEHDPGGLSLLREMGLVCTLS